VVPLAELSSLPTGKVVVVESLNNTDAAANVLLEPNSSYVAISAAYNIFSALTADGRIVSWSAWRKAPLGKRVPDAVQGRATSPVLYGDTYSMVRTVGGTFELWMDDGADDVCGLLQFPTRLQGENVRALTAGRWHALALLANGTVVAGGCSDSSQAAVPAAVSLEEVTSISAAWNTSYAVTKVVAECGQACCKSAASSHLA
jgi:hypothetical protein